MTKRKPPELKLKTGVPLTYTDELGQEICETISRTSLGLKHLCEKNEHWPIPNTIYRWRDIVPGFREMYAQAKMKQADFLAEEIVDIADNARNDFMETVSEEEGVGYRLNGEHVNRSRLRIDTRKWIASKLLPRVYGDKIQTETRITISHEDALKELE